ncbi:glycosyltransferase family 4 protein [Enterococcus plantarum]|uniref:glycosyltransferase family 4 protein n=1 Tax=Enterococcus plantarum TaxID=1077675 RepID=UPI001A8D6AEC|nr:glycosyltransferase family 4 protein [Enterococcus plantarum]MBO0467084.1 glycosyltransferase family 4 protein [Enterococcus plantarum]
MKNILFLHAGAEMYGADRVLLELLRGLDKELFNPIVVLPNEGPLVEKLEKEKISVFVIPYPILRRKYFNIKGVANYIFHYKKYSDAIIKKLDKVNIEIIHVNTSAVLEGIYIKKKLKAKLVWHIHEIIENPKIVYKVTSFLIGKYSDKVITVSEAVKKHMIASKKISEEKVIVIYNGVDNKIFNSKNDIEYLKDEFQLSQDSVTVGMIGRINSLKGQNEFLDAMEPLLITNENLHVVMAGDVFQGEEWRRENLLKRIASFDKSQNIHCLTYREDCPNLHNLFDVFVLPSIKPDSLPTVVLEAMATQKPIVGFDHGGIGEMVFDGVNGYLVEVANTHEMSIKTQELLDDVKSRKEFGRASLKLQQKLFSLDSYILKFSEIYRDL